MKQYLCIDCGGTFTKYAVIRENNDLLKKGQIKTECANYDLFMANIQKLFKENQDVCGIAMSLPGVLDVETGYAHTGGAIGCIYGVNIAAEISKICNGLPVTIENDAKAAGIAEVADGALKGCRNGVVIVIGTALGGTIVINEEVVRGKNLFAGEISYIYYKNWQDDTSNVTENKKDGRLYTEYCTPKKMCDIYSARTGRQLSSTDNPWLFRQYEKGDKDAEYAIRTCCRDLAMLLFNIQCVTDPEVIAIGGGISNEQILIDLLQEEVAVYAKTHKFSGAPVPIVKACKYKSDANLFGAYFAHRKKFG